MPALTPQQAKEKCLETLAYFQTQLKRKFSQIENVELSIGPSRYVPIQSIAQRELASLGGHRLELRIVLNLPMPKPRAKRKATAKG